MPVTSSERTGGHVESGPLTSSTSRPRRRRRHAIANPRRFAPLAAAGARRARRRDRQSARPRARPSARRWRPSPPPGSAATTARCTRCCPTTPAAHDLAGAPAAHVRPGGGDAHARAGPRRARCATTRRSRSRSRRASSARCAACSSSRPASAKDADPGIDWRAELVYPGLRRGEKLRRETTLPPARDDPGPRRHRDRQGPGPLVRSRTAGVARSPARSARAARAARSRARGARRPGRRAGRADRPRARVRRAPVRHPRRHPLRRRAACSPTASRARAARCAPRSTRSSSAPRSRRSPAATAGSRSCARATGEVLALAGIAQSAPQPPGSTFKIVTLAGVLENEGRQAHGDVPGPDRGRRSRASRSRTPTASPAAARCATPSRTPATPSSRRSGAQLGAEKLVETAEKFGFNERPGADGRGALDDPRRGRDRRRPRRRLVRDRPGQGAGHAAADGARRRRRSAPTACARTRRCSRATTRSACARPAPSVAPHDQELHAHRRHRRHRRRRGARRASRSRARPAPRSCARRSRRSRRPRSPIPTQPPPEDDTTDTDAWFAAFAPYTQAERSPSPCCSSARARAATPPRPRPGIVLKAAL